MRNSLLAYILLIWAFLPNSMVFCQKHFALVQNFENTPVPDAPDYSNLSFWAAHPEKSDNADKIPKNAATQDHQDTAKVDVFFVHPTIFTYKPKNEYVWNASLQDEQLNQKVDESTILHQAAVFNATAKVYAPRYRQAHYSAFTTENKNDAVQSLDLAYTDVKKAFEYYLEHFNHDRPIILASHSQGTVHCKRLMKEFFDGKPLQRKLVAAYLVGIAVRATEFENIKPANSPEETGGFITWNTLSRGYLPPWYDKDLKYAICTNPLTWKTDDSYAPYELNKGGVNAKYKLIDKPIDAQVHKGVLWIGKLHVPGAFLLRSKNWHVADYNLYWMNIRENVALRAKSYLLEHAK